ncbi:MULTISPECIES: hypothetical protein [unclassified Mycoavidus]|nr:MULTISPECIES: hypothetical protein [unclassified Mycoavidus]UAW64111.1 hypothetical protein KMZ15_08755 [Mycoavidus sp. HKI]UUM21533.1 hypothetical protein NQD60_08960 [Mycoavidus sp. SF9855]
MAENRHIAKQQRGPSELTLSVNAIILGRRPDYQGQRKTLFDTLWVFN